MRLLNKWNDNYKLYIMEVETPHRFYMFSFEIKKIRILSQTLTVSEKKRSRQFKMTPGWYDVKEQRVLVVGNPFQTETYLRNEENKFEFSVMVWMVVNIYSAEGKKDQL